MRRRKTTKPDPIVIPPAPEPITINKLVDNEIQAYKNFAFNKNMLVVAIGLIMATAFQKAVTGISDFLIMPIVNYFVGKTGDDWRKWVIHPVNGMNIELGHFLGSFVDFVIITLVLYLIYQFFLRRFWPDLTINQPNLVIPTQPITPVATETICLKKDAAGHWKVVNEKPS